MQPSPETFLSYTFFEFRSTKYRLAETTNLSSILSKFSIQLSPACPANSLPNIFLYTLRSGQLRLKRFKNISNKSFRSPANCLLGTTAFGAGQISYSVFLISIYLWLNSSPLCTSNFERIYFHNCFSLRNAT